MEKIYVIEDPDERSRTRRILREEQLRDDKNPAAAYSISLLLWGMGQFYADLVVKGLIFFFLMLLVAGTVVFAVAGQIYLLDLLRDVGVAVSDAFLASQVLLLIILVFWAYNAADAYHVAARDRSRPFTGVKSRVFPGFCSLLFPGWGQYLNGQPVKGGFFAAISVVSIFSLLVVGGTLLAWPLLEPSRSRDIAEGIFAAALFAALPSPFLWIFGSYDAFKVSSDEYLKEPFLERLKATNNRRRTQGWMRGVFPRLKHIFVLILILLLFLAVAYWTFPDGYYVSLLRDLHHSLLRRGMTIMPGAIDTLLAAFPPHS